MHESFDLKIRRLVAAIDAFEGLTVIGGCAGHPDPQPDQWPQGAWYVKFIVQQTDSLMTSTIKFAAPMMLVLVLIDLGFGLITRAADKLEPTNLSQPVKGAVTMLMLALLIGVLVSQVRHLLLPTGLLQQLQGSLQAR